MNFQFTDENLSPEHGSLRVEIPAGITNKQALFAAIDGILRLPDYFGGNWDAFEECMRDLDWLDAKRVLLIHKDVPMNSATKEASTYLSILWDAVTYWRGRGQHELVVVFPQGSETEVAQLRDSWPSAGGTSS